MTDYIFQKQFSVPAGNGATTQTTFNTNTGTCTVERIIVNFPSGCMGNVGIIITAGGSPVFPNNGNLQAFFDGYVWDVNPTMDHTSGQWGFIASNTDFLPHIIRTYFYCNYLRKPSSPSSAKLISL